MKRLILALGMTALLVLTQGCATVTPTGRVNVDGEAISHAIAGEGRPTIVFEAGLGEGMDSWGGVFAAASSISTAFAYDRPGYGGSRSTRQQLGQVLQVLPGSDLLTLAALLGPDRPAITGAGAADRLDRLLNERGLEPPYVLAGHSLGGQYALIYAARYPQKVAGILLVDSRPKGFSAACKAGGLSPCEVPSIQRALSPEHIQAEIDGLNDTDAMTPRPDALGDIPVIRLVAGKRGPGISAEFHALWWEMQQAEAAAQARGRVQLVEGAGHFIMTDQPQAVTEALHELVSLARNDSRSARINAPAENR